MIDIAEALRKLIANSPPRPREANDLLAWYESPFERRLAALLEDEARRTGAETYEISIRWGARTVSEPARVSNVKVERSAGFL